jgi:tRNA(Ile)-lysidine synthetase-like protein
MSQKLLKQDQRQKKSQLEKLNLHLPTSVKSALIAVSGGVDSIVLLDLFIKLKKSSNLDIRVAHIDHKLRKESHLDVGLVASICEKNKIPFYLFEASSPPVSNIESWGRNIRYKFFKDIVESLNLDLLATAHTLNDQVETFLMQMFSNKEIAPMEYYDPRRKLFRPLLEVPKAKIINYAIDHNLIWNEDNSNNSDKYLRNRIRNKLIPTLNNIFDGDVEKTVFLQMQKIDRWQNVGKSNIDLEIEALNIHDFGSAVWFRSLKSTIQKYSSVELYYFVGELFYPKVLRRFGYDWAERIKSFVLGNSVGLQLPGGFNLKRKNGGIELTQMPPQTKLT